MAEPPTQTIEQVTKRLIDYRGKTPKKTDHGIPLITAKIIKNGTILNSNYEYIAEDSYDSWMRRGLPQYGDILITTEAPLGEVAQLRMSDKVALAQRVILLRGDPTVIDQQYYFQALKSPLVQARLQARATGTTVSGIKQSELRQVEIPCPPLPLQRKIASVLSAYDDLIENNTRRIQILEEMAQSIYREWFVNFRFPGYEKVRMVDSPLGKIPEGWEVKKATDAVAINPKTKLPKDDENPFVPMSSLSNNSMLIQGIETRSGNSGSKFKNGDTLFARITPSLENGKTGYVQFLLSDEDVAFGSTEFIVLRSETLSSEYVYCMARSDEFRDNAIKSMTGATGRQRVQEGTFNRFLFAHPDKEVVERFSEFASSIYSNVRVLAEKNRNLQSTRDLLLPKLVSGEVYVEKTNVGEESEL